VFDVALGSVNVSEGVKGYLREAAARRRRRLEEIGERTAADYYDL